MKHKIWIQLILIALLPLGLFAQEDTTLSFTLNSAQEYAIQNNLMLENAKLDIESAEKKVWETTAIGLPQINATLDYQHIPGDLPTASFGGDSTTALLYDYILTSLSDLGYPPSQDLSDALSTPAEPFTLGVKNSTTYGATVSQLIFSGEYIVGLQASKTYLQISKLNHEKQELDLRATVINSYISILILENNLKIINESIDNMQLLVEETKQMYRQGFLESTDVDQLQINLNTLINSKKTVERQIEISYMLFKIVLGTDLDAELALAENLTTVYEQIVGKAVNTEFDVTGNIDYRMMDNQVKISELSLKREKSTYLPTVSAFYNYQDKTNKASFDFTINHIIGVNVSMPIFSSFQRNAKVQQAKIDLEKSINNQTLLERNLKAQTQQLRFNFQNALDKYGVTMQNVDLSKRVFENTSKRYKEGMVSSMDLTQANTTYLQAESDKTTALFELIQTKIELEKILNEL
jgi:outer membrane protein TolC